MVYRLYYGPFAFTLPPEVSAHIIIFTSIDWYGTELNHRKSQIMHSALTLKFFKFKLSQNLNRQGECEWTIVASLSIIIL